MACSLVRVLATAFGLRWTALTEPASVEQRMCGVPPQHADVERAYRFTLSRDDRLPSKDSVPAPDTPARCRPYKGNLYPTPAMTIDRRGFLSASASVIALGKTG